MSEQKRVPFQTLGTTKREKKGEEFVQSYRFTLTLPESNEQACPEFNYRELLKAAEKKRKKENKKGDENNANNGLDPHDDDDDEKLQEMAKKFEAKYGTATGGRKKHNRYDDYVDLGAGYDESDSFIDNTDAYDEIVPEEWTTVRGGFYINSGPLEFKTSEGNSLIGNNNNNNNIEDESSESSEEEPEELGSPKQTKKRTISSSEDDETEDAASDQPPKRAKMDDNGEKNSSNEAAMKKKKKIESSGLNRAKNAVVRDLLKVKGELREADVQDDNQEDKKRAEKIESNKPKNVLEKKFDIKRFEKKASSNGLDVKKPETKKIGFYDDTIESVVNAARVEDQSSSDTMDSCKSRSIVCSNSDCDEAMDKEESPLPDALTEEMKDIINKLKAHAENSKEGKTKFFNGPINSTLFGLEKKLRSRYTPSVRLQTYAHLAHFLPCSKPTLVNRAKKLYLQDVEDKVKSPIEKLKAAIDRIMPSIMVKYTRDCQRVADEKGVEGSPSDNDSSDGDDSANKSSEKSKIPQRRFPWNEETKKLVAEIAAARREYFEILKPRKETVEMFVSAFMDAKVRPLWPPGWVRLQTLIKYSNPQLLVKRKSKKHKEGSAVPDIQGTTTTAPTATTTTTITVTTKSDFNSGNNNEAVIQERVKSPTNFIKTINAQDNQQQSTKSGECVAPQLSSQMEKKCLSKSKDKSSRESPVGAQYSTSTSCTITNSSSHAKISVVPTAQLMAPKLKADKFNPMDLTSSSLSITPVNDYHKSSKITEFNKECKKEVLDTVSITPCNEDVVVDVGNAGGTGGTSVSQCGLAQQSSTYISTTIPKSIPIKHRILHEDLLDSKQQDEKTTVEKECVTDTHNKTDRKEKKDKRSGGDSRHKSHDSKKRKKEHKAASEVQSAVKSDSVNLIQSSISKEEQEQRQIEETMAATNFLSQIINDDAPRPMTEKRKESGVLDETTGNIIPPSEQENDVQMVMRSLKELQELQEMKYSPSHSPVSVIQKPSKSSSTNMRFVSYDEDYQHLYHKKDDKMRSQKKEDAQW